MVKTPRGAESGEAPARQRATREHIGHERARNDDRPVGPATPPSLGEGIRRAVAGVRGVELDAAHLANVERPEAFNAAVIEFLTP